MRSGIRTAVVGLAICLPCLVPLLIAAGIGAGAFSVIGSWFSDSGLVLGAAAAVAVAFVTLAGIMYARRTTTAACDVPEAEEPDEKIAPVRDITI